MEMYPSLTTYLKDHPDALPLLSSTSYPPGTIMATYCVIHAHIRGGGWSLSFMSMNRSLAQEHYDSLCEEMFEVYSVTIELRTFVLDSNYCWCIHAACTDPPGTRKRDPPSLLRSDLSRVPVVKYFEEHPELLDPAAATGSAEMFQIIWHLDAESGQSLLCITQDDDEFEELYEADLYVGCTFTREMEHVHLLKGEKHWNIIDPLNLPSQEERRQMVLAKLTPAERKLLGFEE